MFKGNTLEEKSWIMYDWANSVYATIIMAAILPIYFAAQHEEADAWWAWGTSLATFVVAVLAPVLGAVADYKGMKKKLLTFFLVLGVVFTSTIAFTDNWRLMLVGYIISYIGFAGANLFYDSFLTDVTTHERMDGISAKGYAMGYIGGSTIPFLIAIALVFLMPDNNALAVKISIVLTSVWWAVFSIPILKNCRQTHSLGEPPKDIVKQTFLNVGRTLKSIVTNKALLFFMLAYFFYIDGVGTVIHLSTAYGSTLGLSSTGMILALLVTQLVAAPCSILFAKLADKVGSLKMIGLAIIVYFLICGVGFYMGWSLEPTQNEAESAFDSAYLSVLPDANDDSSENYKLYNSLKNTISSSDRVEEAEALIMASKLEDAEKSSLTAAVIPVMEAVSESGAHDLALRRSNILFWIMAVMVGTCQGGIQALSRSYFGKLIPPEKSNEYYGFFDIFGKFAAVIGPALYGFVRAATGSAALGILGLMVLFAAGGALLLAGRKHLKAAEQEMTAREMQT
ncbi:MAG: MFS transporter [Oscillospiraceae bacterium]|nr:MFS transporter [Oscillospiraceae bacterium]